MVSPKFAFSPISIRIGDVWIEWYEVRYNFERRLFRIMLCKVDKSR